MNITCCWPINPDTVNMENTELMITCCQAGMCACKSELPNIYGNVIGESICLKSTTNLWEKNNKVFIWFWYGELLWATLLTWYVTQPTDVVTLRWVWYSPRKKGWYVIAFFSAFLWGHFIRQSLRFMRSLLLEKWFRLLSGKLNSLKWGFQLSHCVGLLPSFQRNSRKIKNILSGLFSPSKIQWSRICPK